MTDWFAYPSNFSNTSVDGLGSLVQYNNLITHGALGLGMIVSIFLITMFTLFTFGFTSAVTVASFSAFIFSLYLLNIGAVSIVLPITFMSITVILAIVLFFDRISL